MGGSGAMMGPMAHGAGGDQNKEDAKRKSAESRNARGTAKTAKVAATAKRVRQAGNAARKKVSR